MYNEQKSVVDEQVTGKKVLLIPKGEIWKDDISDDISCDFTLLDSGGICATKERAGISSGG